MHWTNSSGHCRITSTQSPKYMRLRSITLRPPRKHSPDGVAPRYRNRREPYADQSVITYRNMDTEKREYDNLAQKRDTKADKNIGHGFDKAMLTGLH